MRKKILTAVGVIGLIAAALAVSRPAGAALGEQAESIATDRISLYATKRAVKVAVQNSYTVHEIAADLFVVREYVGKSGVVFGVAWKGMIEPDLAQILGRHADDYRKALKTTPRPQGRRGVHVTTDGAVVEKWGHMRNLQGRAYIPELIPPGVKVDDIK